MSRPGEDAPGVLLVDDRRENLMALEAVLAPLGARLVTAQSGEEALKALLTEEFATILLDVQMPGMDGLTATRAIRSGTGPNTGTPIVAFSANVLADQLAACRVAGMNDHIAKPIDMMDLVTKVALWSAAGEREPPIYARSA